MSTYETSAIHELTDSELDAVAGGVIAETTATLLSAANTVASKIGFETFAASVFFCDYPCGGQPYDPWR
jgi:hypothetical protein